MIKKHLKRKVPLISKVLMLVLLSSCRIEDEMFSGISQNNSEANKFNVFVPLNGESVNYAKGFKTLLERKDSIDNKERTLKSFRRNTSKTDAIINTEYIEFNIHSQDMVSENGDRKILFPLIENNTVKGIIVAVLEKDETEVQFMKLKEDSGYYSTVLPLFKKAYLKTNTNTNAKTNGGGITYGTTDIDEVIIPTPTNPNPIWGWNIYIPGGGGCQGFASCIFNDWEGQNGGIVPPDIITNPCEKMKTIGKANSTKSFFEDLKSKTTNSNSEHGYVLKNTGNNIEGNHIQGNPGESGITFPTNSLISGIIHSHYSGLLSIFSPEDVLAIATLYYNGQIDNTNTFIMGVVTASGTQYIITIDDINMFNSFVNSVMQGGQLSDGLIDAYNAAYETIYKINETNTPNANEENFTRFLDLNKTGLKVLKGDSSFNNWSLLSKDTNGNIISQNCP